MAWAVVDAVVDAPAVAEDMEALASRSSVDENLSGWLVGCSGWRAVDNVLEDMVERDRCQWVDFGWF